MKCIIEQFPRVAGFATGVVIILTAQIDYSIDVPKKEKVAAPQNRPDEKVIPVYSAKDEACLARNVYYEAGVESKRGKAAVAQVTLNRLATGRWGNSICDVVYAKSQFSWTLIDKLKKPSGKAWADARWVARRALRGEEVPSLKTALYYHADYVTPYWREPKAKIKKVGQHIFYAYAKTAQSNG